MISKMKIFTIKTLFLLFIFTQSAFSDVVKKVEINGNQRITDETIRVFGDIILNEDYNPEKINSLLLNLYETNFFSNVDVKISDNLLIINVVENPIIRSLEFKGIKSNKKKEKILEIITLKEKTSFVESEFENDLKRIKSAFKNSGYYFVDIEAYKKVGKNNSIDLIYEIDLGPKSKIKKIVFLGDKKIKDSKLRSVITSEESRAWKIISQKKYLNEKIIKLDVRLLEQFYKNRGYYEVTVFPSNVNYTESDDFILTYNITAGKKYFIKEINLLLTDDLKSDQPLFDDIKKLISKSINKPYSINKIDKILNKIESISARTGLEFLKTELKETLDGNSILIDLNVVESEKYYVEQINITGNSVTNDSVIRSGLIIDEGDAFNELLLNRSINNLKGKRIFAEVKKTVKDGSSKNFKIINIDVEEKATGEISVGAGYGTSGGTFGFNVSENNFLGKGISLSTKLNVSKQRLTGRVVLDNPNYKLSGNSLSTVIESTKTSKMSDFGYESTVSGFAFGTGFEQWDDIFVNPEIATYYETIKTSNSASANLKKQKGNYFETALNYSIINDKRNQRYQPTEGYKVSFNQVVPLYSDAPSLTNGFDFSSYWQIKNNVIASTTLFTRAINSLSNSNDVKISTRLRIPQKYLRGFEAGKIGPNEKNDYVGGNYATALGFKANFPKLFSGLQNFDFSLFLDTANLWGVDYDDGVNGSGGSIRSSFGIATDVYTPVGPLSFSLAQPISKEKTDTTETFRFNLGTTF